MNNNDIEPEPSQDDLDVEITDLDDLEIHNGHNRSATTATTATASPVRLSLRSRLSPRQRVLRLAITAGTLVLASLIILGNIASIRGKALGMIFGPTPAPESILVPGTDLFYIDANPSWGKLFLDGQLLAHLPIKGQDSPLHLSQGHHQFVWRAEPFRPISCFISVPGASTDTCHYILAVQDQFGPTRSKIVPASRQMVFYESLVTLNPVQRTALIQAVQATLDTQQSTETVYPGEQYIHIVGKHTIDTARQSLRAALRFQLDTPNEPGSPCKTNTDPCTIQFGVEDEPQNCLLFCSLPDASESLLSPVNGWYAIVITHSLWDFATSNGQVIAQDQPDAPPGTNNIQPAHPTLLQITWAKGNWHVVLPIFPHTGINSNSYLTCVSADEFVSSLPSPRLDSTQVTNANVSWNSAAGSVLADGCVDLAQLGTNESGTPFPSPSPQSPTAYCLYRFGVLLAANDLAHRWWPQLPLADAYERSIAQQLAASIG